MRAKKKPTGPSYDPAGKFGWGEGDIEIIKPGTGLPLLSEAELDRIIAENRRAPGAEVERRALRKATPRAG